MCDHLPHNVVNIERAIRDIGVEINRLTREITALEKRSAALLQLLLLEEEKQHGFDPEKEGKE